MNLKQMRAAALKAAQDIIAKAKAENRDLTDEEQVEVEAKFAEIEDLDEKIEKAEKSAALIARLTDAQPGEMEKKGDDSPLGNSLGDRFVKSEAFKSFRKSHPSGVSNGTPVHVEVKGLGSVADVLTKATLTTVTGQSRGERLPTVQDYIVRQPTSLLDLITVGRTTSTSLEYVQVTAETDNAAIVAEGELKPLSDITTALADAKVFTYADGFDATNQFLADEPALASYMDSALRFHLRNLIEDKLLNGTGTATDPKGILTTSGVQQQAFATDVIGTIAASIQKLQAVGVDPQAIVMNPADAWALRMTKNGDQWALGNPLQQNTSPTPFGVPLVTSHRVTAGTALVGNFRSVMFLEREPLNVVAFNQHKDYAQRNMTYVRAELRGIQLFQAPREVVVADLTAA